MNKTAIAGCFLAATLTMSACTDPEYNSLIVGNRVSSAGAGQMLAGANEEFSASRLAIMIEEAISPAIAGGDARPPTVPGDGPEAIARLDRALANFTKVPYQPGLVDRALEQNRMRDARNTIQDQLLAASNNRCNVYKTYLRRTASYTQFGLGSIATALAGAGAIVSGGASQALSGAASIFSGVNAEFQKDFLGSLMTSVVIPGIDRQRGALRNDIVDKSCAGISDYPLTLAIAEVIRYHGACSADVGIAASGQAVARTTPDSISAVLAAAQQARRVTAALRTPTAAEVRDAAANAAAAAASLEIAKRTLAQAEASLATATEATREARTRAVEVARRNVDNATLREARAKQVAAGLQGATTVERWGNDPASANANPAHSEEPLLGAVLPRPNCDPLNGNGKRI